MCGIVGAFDHKTKRDFDAGLIHKMNASLSHRGPDAGAQFLRPGIALGHRRLSIIDLADGQQPMSDASGAVTVVFNGEIYNFQALRQTLQDSGHLFRTLSDTEVIIHAWREWGPQCVDRLNGMFAFAIWDESHQTVFLARDRLGIKPLYYSYSNDGVLYFGSELKALLQVDSLPRAIDMQAVEEYFAFGYVPDPRSILAGIKKLSPGFTLLHRRGNEKPRHVRYWDVNYSRAHSISADEARENLVNRLRSSVAAQTVSDVPLGAFLSGGIDSSTVVTLLSQLSDSPVTTCNIGFEDSGFDESGYAAQVAALNHTDHHSEIVNSDLFNLVDTIGHHYDEPFADSSALPTYRVCEVTRRRVKVALSGDGGDELFFGYRRHVWQRNLDLIRRMFPDSLRGPLLGAIGKIYPQMSRAPRFLRGKATLQAAAQSSADGFFSGVSLVSDSLRAQLYSKSLHSKLQGYSARDVFHSHASRLDSNCPFALMQYLDIKTYLPGDILTKVDRVSMAHGLEVRVPFLDHEFVDWASRIPGTDQLNRSSGKLLLKDAVRPILPDGIVDRRKMGFSIPMANWLRGPLRDRLQTALTRGAIADSGLFNQGTINDLLRQHQDGARDNSDCLWALLMFERFLERVQPEIAR